MATWKLLLALVSSLSACGGPHAPMAVSSSVIRATPEQIANGEALAGSYVVVFRPAPQGKNLLRFPSFAAEYQTHFSLLEQRFGADRRVKSLDFLTALDLAPDMTDDSQPLGRFAVDRTPAAPQVGSVTRVDFNDPLGAEEALTEWDQAGAIWYAEPNYISKTTQEPAPAENLFKAYSAAYAKLGHWWIAKINMPQALEAIGNRDLAVAGTPTDLEIKTNAPIVAVMDSGVDYAHPALAGRIWENTDVNAANCDNDIHGCNTTVATRGKLGNGEVYPYGAQGPGQACDGLDGNCSHGTHVAGLVAADAAWVDPGRGDAIGGTCPVCQIMIVKIVSKIGNDSGILDSSIIAGFKYVALFRREGSSAVRVVNASFGKFIRSRTVGLMIRLMKDKRGALVVAAAGNEDTLTMEYPAAFTDSVAVAAVDNKLRKSVFSNFGRWVDIAAPGQGLLSTVPGGMLDIKSGTSMASPVVAGIAAMMLARYPKISYDDLRHWLLNSADPTLYSRDYENGFNYTNYYPRIEQEATRQPLLGFGLVNAQAAINLTPSEGLPLFTELDRVQPGCSAVGVQSAPAALFLLLAALFLPLSKVFRRKIPGRSELA